MEDRENITGISPSIYNSQKGYANQLVSCGILLRLGYEALLAETGNSFYDLILLLNNNGTVMPVKTGVRTLANSLSFGVNQGGGVNRPRPIGRGVQHPSLNDVQLWVGVTKDFDLYFFPHRLIYNKQRLHRGTLKPIGSLSKNIISHTKNNTLILDNFFDDAWLQIHVVAPIAESRNWR